MKQLIAGSKGCTEILRKQTARDSQDEKEHLRRFEEDRVRWDQLSGGSAPLLSPEARELQRAIEHFEPPSSSSSSSAPASKSPHGAGKSSHGEAR